jgi:hypothetical protein
MILPSGAVTWLVPSGWAMSFQPIWCSTTWWWNQHYADLGIMPVPGFPALVVAVRVVCGPA